MPFDGLRVLSLESRRAAEIERLIRTQGGVPVVAPSMREVPLTDNPQAFDFAAKLLGGEVEMVIFLTGVGTRLLNQALETRYPAGTIIEALKQVTTVARGPKPAAVLREWAVPITVLVPEPNTWREILKATEARNERKIFIQEYGRPATELTRGLAARGAEVTSVPVYQWALPLDLDPLREAAHAIAQGRFDVLLLTAAIQVEHLFQVASTEGIEQQLRRALPQIVVASVGPTTSETLAELGIAIDFEPSHPKMGFLVTETAQHAGDILKSKQREQPEAQ
jgi:uroporphyrinogen-III synthase